MISKSSISFSVADVAPAAPLAGTRRWAFFLAVGAALLVVAPMAPFLVIPLAWPFMAEELGVHHVHDIAVSAMLWLMVGGLLMQLRGAQRQVAAMQQVLIVVLTMLLLTAISRPQTLAGFDPLFLVFALIFLAAALHPARSEIARVRLRADPFLAGLAILAAGPLLVYGWGQLRLDHSALPLALHGGHWTAMAILAVVIVALALLAATRPRGWRVPAWSVGGAALLLGISSAVLPLLPSSIGPGWGALAALWGCIFVATAEVRFGAISEHGERRP